MKNIFKKIALVVTFILLVASMGILATGCGKKIDSIVIQDEPRLIYVQGQDLDLTEGTITVKQKKKTSEVDLSNPEVKVSGYKKNQLGEQELTVTYKEKTATYTIKVIPWVEVIGYEQNYFINDEFNKTRGSLKVAKEDGTTRTVSMSDNKVSIEGFNSGSALQGLTVTAIYNDGGVVREGEFAVNIYDAEEVQIYSDSVIKNYKSHETEFKPGSGYIKVTAANGQLQKEVSITTDMVKGFNPSLATEENIEKPLEQDVYISYAGTEKKVTIKITYSYVSYVKSRIEAINKATKDKDWTEGKITIDTEIGIMAEEAMREYFNLSATDKALIDKAEMENAARCAIIYGLDSYNKQRGTAFKVIEINEKGVFSVKFDGKYEDVKGDLAKIDDKDEFMIYIVPLLKNVVSTFGKVTIANTTLSECVGSLYLEEDLKAVKSILNLLVGVYDDISHIPTEWDMDVLKANKIHIANAVARIKNSPFNGVNYSDFLSVASTWREKDDLYDIIYYYYTYSDNLNPADIFATVTRPHEVEDLFVNFNLAFSEVVSDYLYPLKLNNENNLFYLYLKDALTSYDNIMKGDNQFYKDILDQVDMDTLFFINVMQTASYGSTGYYKLAGAFAEDPAFVDLLNKYLETAIYYHTDPNNYDASKNARETEEFFKAFVEATPTVQFTFIGSLYQLYVNTDSENLRNLSVTYTAEKDNYTVNNTLSYIIAAYYGSILPNSTKDILPKLLSAIENYALRYKFESAEVLFKKDIEELKALVEKVKTENAKDYEVFESKLGFAYDKYVKLYENLDGSIYEGIDLGEWADDFIALSQIITDCENYVNAIEEYRRQNKDSIPMTELTLFMMSYEKALKIKTDICNNAGDTIVNYFANANVSFSSDVVCSYEYALLLTFDTYNNYMLTVSMGGEFVRGIYKVSSLDKNIADFYDIMKAHYEEDEVDVSIALDAMRAFLALTDEGKIAFYRLGLAENYYETVTNALESTLTEEEMAIAEALIKVERAYVEYAYAPNSPSEEGGPTHTEEFKTAIQELNELKESFEETENYNTYLKAMYDFYLAEYNKIAE